MRASEIYKGDYTQNAPDLIVLYEEGYRASWQTALGGAPEKETELNLNKWSGDHCIHPAIVPGVLFANTPLRNQKPSLLDIAPTVLNIFGLYDENKDDMDGKPLY